MTTEYRVLVPWDVLYLRGNRLFGEAGDHAEPEMPPWPSLFAGALRSLVLVQGGSGTRLEDFAASRVNHPVLGTPSEPGPFAVTHVSLARRSAQGWEALLPLPGDVQVAEEAKEPASQTALGYFRPVRRDDLSPLLLSTQLAAVLVLRVQKVTKAGGRAWLTPNGFKKYLQEEQLEPGDVIRREELWKVDSRLGIALDPTTRTAAQGRIYTTDAVALSPNVGFLVGVRGADGQLPRTGAVRLGGDGRGAELAEVAIEETWVSVPETESFRLILRTPGLSPEGWVLPGLAKEEDGWRLRLGGLRARLVTAVVPRYQVISGWDLAAHKPKPAWRVIPAGSVYWFETEQKDLEALRQLVTDGLWVLYSDEQRKRFATRRPEGWNQVSLGNWQGLQ